MSGPHSNIGGRNDHVVGLDDPTHAATTALSALLPPQNRSLFRGLLGSRSTELRFTVRRPASAEVSPRCHRPSGGDVACGVDVGIARPRTAGDALENRLALTIFRRDMPAVGASLRRVRCWNEFKPPQGLVLEPGNQQPPPLAVDLAVEAPFLRDVGTRAFTSPARRACHRTHVLLICLSGLVCLKYVKVVAGQWFSSRPQGLLWAFGAADEVGQGVGIGVDALLQESVEEHSAGL